jgi:hypothetical protein
VVFTANFWNILKQVQIIEIQLLWRLGYLAAVDRLTSGKKASNSKFGQVMASWNRYRHRIPLFSIPIPMPIAIPIYI